MPLIETRLISDLADPSVDNSVEDNQSDYLPYDVALKLINSNQVSLAPGPIAAPNQLPERPLNALIIESLYDEIDPETKDTYEVLTEEKELKEVKSLNFDTDFQPGDSVIIYPPIQGDVWRLVNEKLQHLEEFVRLEGDITGGTLSFTEIESARLNSDPADDFETIVGSTITLPRGYYDIRIKVRRMAFIAVAMTKTGGSSGDETTKCSWLYTVKNANTNEEYATDYSPVDDGHWERPPVGPMKEADVGLWRNDKVYWCNEVIDSEAC